MDIGGDEIKTKSYAYFPPYTSPIYRSFEECIIFHHVAKY